MRKRIVVGVSGASGTELAQMLLIALQKQPEAETHLIVSDGARLSMERETGLDMAALSALADRCYGIRDMDAPVSSGSYPVHGMVVIPCSMKTAAGIATGYSDNLLLRAADVAIKERRSLVLVPRESPLSAIHLQNLLTLAQAGVTILPPMLSFYKRPASAEQMCALVVHKALACLGFEPEAAWGWEG